MNSHKKIGLVLSGGGANGAFEAGALKAINELNIPLSIISGTSIGGLNGYMAAMDLFDELENYWLNVHRYDILNINPLRKMLFFKSSSLLKDKVQREFLHPFVDYKKLKKSKTELITSAVCLQTGEIEFFSSKNFGSNQTLENAILATAAIPGIFPPIKINKRQYIDGGILENTPISPLLNKKLDGIIVISLVPDKYTFKQRTGILEIILQSMNIFFRGQANKSIEEINNLAKEQKKFLSQKKKLNKIIDEHKLNNNLELVSNLEKIVNSFSPTKRGKKAPPIYEIQPNHRLSHQPFDFKQEAILDSFSKGYKKAIKVCKSIQL